MVPLSFALTKNKPGRTLGLLSRLRRSRPRPNQNTTYRKTVLTNLNLMLTLLTLALLVASHIVAFFAGAKHAARAAALRDAAKAAGQALKR